jgi:hypothetical protein
MTLDIIDSITELQTTQKEAKAILDGFMSQFTSNEMRTNKLAIEANPERYQYTAHVICDLLYRAIQQTAELEKMADAEMKKKAV